MSLCEIEHLLREATPRVLGAVVRRFKDFASAEDAVQEALLAASTQWPRDGVPVNPAGWLVQVATRRMADYLRSEAARRRRESDAAPSLDSGALDAAPDVDDTLLLLEMCCDPALSDASAIALTLRAIGGLTTAAIAHAFLVPEATMAQRISRAKQQIKAGGLSAGRHAHRLPRVLHVLYLMFNEGYTTSAGPDLLRPDLSHEAIRLARIVHALQPEACEAAGLLALMLLTDARRAARTGVDGELIALTEQDRALWNRDQIAEGIGLLSATLPRGSIGPYQLQAAIAAVHDEAASADATDWPQILALYGLLKAMAANPMVSLNHAIAMAMVRGPRAGLDLIDAIPGLDGHHRRDAVRAHLLEMAGEREAAIEHYRAAAAKTGNIQERNYLVMRAAKLAYP